MNGGHGWKKNMKYSSDFMRTDLEPTGESYPFGVRHFLNSQGSPTSDWLLCGTGSLDEGFKTWRLARHLSGTTRKGVLPCLGQRPLWALSAESLFLPAAGYPASLGTYGSYEFGGNTTSVCPQITHLSEVVMDLLC